MLARISRCLAYEYTFATHIGNIKCSEWLQLYQTRQMGVAIGSDADDKISPPLTFIIGCLSSMLSWTIALYFTKFDYTLILVHYPYISALPPTKIVQPSFPGMSQSEVKSNLLSCGLDLWWICPNLTCQSFEVFEVIEAKWRMNAPVKFNLIVWDNGLSPVRCQTLI